MKNACKENFSQQRPLVKFISSTKKTSWQRFKVCLYFVVFKQTSPAYTNNNIVCIACWMDVTVWKTGRLLIMFLIIRLLASVTFSLSSLRLLPLSPPTHTYAHSHRHVLWFSIRSVPTSKASLPLISLITQTVRSSSPSSPSSASSMVLGNEKNEPGGNQGREDGGDDLFIFGRFICSERCCFGSKNFSCDMHPIDSLKWLPTQQRGWVAPLRLQIGRWESSLHENSRYLLQPSSSLFYWFSSTSISSLSMSPVPSALLSPSSSSSLVL